MNIIFFAWGGFVGIVSVAATLWFTIKYRDIDIPPCRTDVPPPWEENFRDVVTEPSPSPIARGPEGWYHWDSTWSVLYGPYETRERAVEEDGRYWRLFLCQDACLNRSK
jgi:hypothetical protein